MATPNEQSEKTRNSEELPQGAPKASTPSDRVSVYQLARQAKLIKPARVTLNGVKEVITARFRAAAYLHGWTKETKLTRDEFDAAIKAVSNPDEKGNYTAHDPARAANQRSS